MRSLRKMMAVAQLFPSMSLLVVSAFFLTFMVSTALGQDPVPTTPANPELQPTDSPSPSDQPSPTYPVDLPSTTPSTVTCCYVQTACKNCTEVYNVNSIVYCCPNCRGMVLVTDLVCRCTIPKLDPVQDLQCKLSNQVVGGYDALRPSYYDGGGCAMIRASVALMLSAALMVASVAL